jgi:hypothetical protein
LCFYGSTAKTFTGGCEVPTLRLVLGCFPYILLGLVVCSRLRDVAMRERLFSIFCVLAAGDKRCEVGNFLALIGAYFSAIRMRGDNKRLLQRR